MFKGLKSLIAGLLGGAALGVLFAPKKGKEFRKDLKEEVNEGGTGINTIKKSAVEMGKDLEETYCTCSDKVTSSEEYKEGKRRAKRALKKNIPPETRRKAKRAYKKAKTTAKTAKKAVKGTKKGAGKAKKGTQKKSKK